MTSGGMRRKGYIRIEHEAGGAARLAMSEYDSDAIDKVTDARAKKSFEHSEIKKWLRSEFSFIQVTENIGIYVADWQRTP